MKVWRWLDGNLEKSIILVNYVVMAAIIFVEVIRRFLISEQVAWSTTIPIYLFLWVVYIGCAYNVKIRAHLRFDELRRRMPYKVQYGCLLLDSILWITFSIIIIIFTVEQVMLARDNFAIVQGTDDVMQWWFYMATPFAFVLLIIRVLQNVHEDTMTFRKGEPLKVHTSVFGD